MKKIRTKKLKSVNSSTLLATVDIGKSTHFGYARCPDRSEVRPFEFSNNFRGFSHFWKILFRRKKPMG